MAFYDHVSILII